MPGTVEMNVIGRMDLSQLVKGLSEAQQKLEEFKKAAGGTIKGGKLTIEIQQKAGGMGGGILEAITGPLGIIAGAIGALVASSAALRSVLGGFVRLFLQLVKPIADVVAMLLRPFLILLRPIVRALSLQMRTLMKEKIRPLQKEAAALFKSGDIAGGTAKLMEAAGATIIGFFGIIGGAVLGAINPFKGDVESAGTAIETASNDVSKSLTEDSKKAEENAKKQFEAGNVIEGAAEILKGNLLTTAAKAFSVSGAFTTLMNPFATYTEKYNAMNSIISTISGIEMPKLKTEMDKVSKASGNATLKINDMAKKMGDTEFLKQFEYTGLRTPSTSVSSSSFLENLPVIGPIARLLKNAGIFQQGGVIPHTGFHYLHKGETVTPAGASASTLNINVMGANSDLKRMIERTVESYMRTQYTNY